MSKRRVDIRLDIRLDIHLDIRLNIRLDIWTVSDIGSVDITVSVHMTAS